MTVNNRGCIWRLGLRSMKMARTRNLVAALAIALTTLLFTSLFTIAVTINYSYQQENFRKMGGDTHGSIKDISKEQVELFRQDPLIVESGARFFVGDISDPPFEKSHVEVSYIEPHWVQHYFCQVEQGSLPQEGTEQVAMDTHLLTLLGVEPKVGAQVTLPICIDSNTGKPQTIEKTLTLSGWWTYDEVVTANHVLLPYSLAQELVAQSNGDPYSMTGAWNLDMMFKNSLNIRENLETILKNQGYQCTDVGQDNYLKIGISWAHTGSRFRENLDPTTTVGVIALLLIIVFTGYLVIYNIFQISVTNDVRFYGLLKTIGTTGRQIKRIVRQQALLLSCMGIPLGLLLGYLSGVKLAPIVMAQNSYKRTFITADPKIFIGATLFSLVTVFLSCRRPGRMAAKVSPVEAVRYTEGGQQNKKRQQTLKSPAKQAANGASLTRMAWANLGRSRSKTFITILSLTLAVLLMNLVVNFVGGFSMDKYVSSLVSTDFVLAHNDHLTAGRAYSLEDAAVPEQLISTVEGQGDITEGGRIYARWGIEQPVAADWLYGAWMGFGSDYAQGKVDFSEHLPDGRVMADARLYAMEDFPLSKLTVVDGSLEPLKDPSQNAIAAVGRLDNFDSAVPGSAWAKVGDTVTLRYVSEWGWFDLTTGEQISGEEVNACMAMEDYNSFVQRPVTYEEKDYKVCAVVTVPQALSFRSYTVGADDYILGVERFKEDADSANIMAYVFDTTEESNAAMEDFLSSYCESVEPNYNYESKQSYVEEFDGFRSMFLTMGGALSFIIGLVGVLNFINAIMTGILARRREFAVLQAVGMTGSQLRRMLVCEGQFYALGSAALALLLCLVLTPLLGNAFEQIFWFFDCSIDLWPALASVPVFALLGWLIPTLLYGQVSRQSVVERLRESE